MTDSDERNRLVEKHDRNRGQRLQAVKRWARYIRTHPAERWGPQQNRLVNAQLQAAREADLSVEHRQRIDEAREER